ncbi:hypothetical protein [Nocardia sp. XZ_19_369]|uniref:hypothetical protein n=1 Tax=Nocardia sp. XZ_19_369 TaxID=2769487 RepID=UPI00188DFBA3|nr:hypothetical protein [Nocardia sp. XZ_19_369]
MPIVAEDGFTGGLQLLIDHLRGIEPPPTSVLRERVAAFADRPRPYLPKDARTAVSETAVAWIDPRRVLLSRAGTASFIHDNSSRPGTGVAPVDGLTDFAGRLAAERADPEGLYTLFGSLDEPMIQVEGWDMPTGWLFRVETNGNHRLTALAALEVPCVLAEIRMHEGMYDTRPAPLDDDSVVLYRQLLHTFGVAAFPELDSFFNFVNIRTRWPILIADPQSAVRSLATVEQLIGHPHTGPIGTLPRQWFDDPGFLTAAAAHLPAHLSAFVRKPITRRRWLRPRPHRRRPL